MSIPPIRLSAKSSLSGSLPIIRTPPPTNLEDADSPTTSLADFSGVDMGLFSSSATHASKSAPGRQRPIYLIVATTLNPAMGIGLRGGLPWGKGLKRDMAWFKRVTEREGKGGGEKGKNAVIMGRRTWESIPPKFRPLPGRLNVVVTRDVVRWRGEVKGGREGGEGHAGGQRVRNEVKDGKEEVLVASSLREGLDELGRLRRFEREQKNGNVAASAAGAATGVIGDIGGGDQDDSPKDFIIGGHDIYRAALDLSSSPADQSSDQGIITRILQTQVRRKDGAMFDCDTYFPLELPENGGSGGWRRAEREETEQWVGGEKLPQGSGDSDEDWEGRWIDDGECEIRVIGWEMVS